MTKKKILIGLTYFYPYISGLSQYALILAEEMAKSGNKVTVITSKYDKKLKDEEEFKLINIVRIRGIRIGKGFLMPDYLIKIKNLLIDCDVVHLHFPSMENVLLAIVSKIFRKKVLATYHCQFNSRNILFDWMVNKWQEIGLLIVDKIFVNSLDYIEGNGLLKQFRSKLFEVDPPIKISKSDKYFDLKGKRKIGFLGRISKEKNLELLIEAFKKLPKDYYLYIAGPKMSVGEEDYRTKITNLLNDRIILLGQVKNPSEFYKSIDCLVLPSNNRLESFGMVAAESISCGTPVVVTNIAGVRVPVIKSGYGEVFESNDVDDLALKIKLVLSKKYEVLYKFDYQRTVDTYEKSF